jgi:hypothetical protein
MKRCISIVVTLGVLLTAPVPTMADELAGCTSKLSKCDLAVSVMEAELTVRRKQVEALQAYSRQVEEQRDRMYKNVDQTAAIPWYLWAVFGMAAGVVLTRGVR